MKRRLPALILAVSLLLSGCSLFDGYYVSVTPYQQQAEHNQTEAISARNYYQLRLALQNLVYTGTESSVIYIADYDSEAVQSNLEDVITYIKNIYPLGAYAVDKIEYEVGIGSGKPAIAITITYNRSRGEIRRIRDVKNMDKAVQEILNALREFNTIVTVQVEEYREIDFVQKVEDFVETYPELVMETPAIAVDVFGNGISRVVEVSFSYQNSRESLKHMKSQVQPIFDSASLYVVGAAQDRQKFSQLYSFLMERFDYSIETSMTPAYSLLCHGVGDSRAFALTYAAMCRRAGLNCRIVTGTRNAEPWTWNMVLDDGYYYHVDLLRSSALGGFDELIDSEMTGYVWDYSAYPECVRPYTPPADEGNVAPAAPAPVEPEVNPEEAVDPTEISVITEETEQTENFE